MTRVATGTVRRRRHKKLLKQTKGHKGQRHRLYRRAHESLIHALQYAYAHRKKKKGDMRRLWNIRINAGARLHGMTYAQFMHGLTRSGVVLDRKILADLAAREPAAFKGLVEQARSAIAGAA